jgi:hypothetical protein
VSGPRFDELVGSDVPSAERERLRRAHEALVAAGPPPDLPPTLLYPPGTDEHLAEVRTLPGRYYAPRRVVAIALAAAMIAAAAFGAGYFVRGGGDGQGPAARRYVALVELRGDAAPNALAAVRVTAPDTVGNREMIVTAEGLPKLDGGDYYTLFMTIDGKPIVTCGTFNVQGGVRRTTVRLVGAYDPAEFDGFALAKYSAVTHRDTVVLTGDIA